MSLPALGVHACPQEYGVQTHCTLVVLYGNFVCLLYNNLKVIPRTASNIADESARVLGNTTERHITVIIFHTREVIAQNTS